MGGKYDACIQEGDVRACCRSVKVCKANALLGQTVEVGSANLSAKATNVREAQIVGDDYEEVGAFRSHDVRYGQETKMQDSQLIRGDKTGGIGVFK